MKQNKKAVKRHSKRHGTNGKFLSQSRVRNGRSFLPVAVSTAEFQLIYKRSVRRGFATVRLGAGCFLVQHKSPLPPTDTYPYLWNW